MKRRREIFDRYLSALAPLEAAGHARLPRVPAHCTPNGHLFYLLTRDLSERTRLIAHLRAAGILSVFHYVPLHTAPMGRALCGEPASLPVTEDLADRLVRLPVFYELDPPRQDRVVDAVLDFYA